MISPDEEKLLKIGFEVALKPVNDLIENIAGPFSRTIGAVLNQMLCDQLRNASRVLSRSAQMLADAGLPFKTIPLKILKGVLDGASVEENEDVQDMWAALLANAQTEGDGKWEVPPAYIDTLRGLSPGDAKVFNYLFGCLSGKRPGDSGVGTLEEFGVELPEYSKDRLYQHLKHLEHHDLISGDLEVKHDLTGASQYRHYYVTPFGGFFYHACQPPKKETGDPFIPAEHITPAKWA